MQGRDQRRRHHLFRQTKEMVSVGVDDVELVQLLAHAGQLALLVGTGYGLVQLPERTWRTGYEPGRRPGRSGRKEGDVMTTPDELLGEREDDTLCPAIADRRNRQDERGNLCNSHAGRDMSVDTKPARQRRGQIARRRP